jgi:hypothetical protein
MNTFLQLLKEFNAVWLVIGGAVGFILKFWLERGRAIELEEKKKELQALLESERHQHSIQLEGIKIELQRNNIQFSKLHQDRVKAMIDIYTDLFNLQGILHLYLLLVRHGSGDDKQTKRTEAYNQMYDQLKKSWLNYRKQKFYFDKSMYVPIELVFKHLNEIEQKVFGWHNSNVSQFDQGYDKGLRDSFRNDLDAAHTILSGHLQTALLSLEDTMRLMLGVAVDPPVE